MSCCLIARFTCSRNTWMKQSLQYAALCRRTSIDRRAPAPVALHAAPPEITGRTSISSASSRRVSRVTSSPARITSTVSGFTPSSSRTDAHRPAPHDLDLPVGVTQPHLHRLKASARPCSRRHGPAGRACQEPDEHAHGDVPKTRRLAGAETEATHAPAYGACVAASGNVRTIREAERDAGRVASVTSTVRRAPSVPTISTDTFCPGSRPLEDRRRRPHRTSRRDRRSRRSRHPPGSPTPPRAAPPGVSRT